MGKTCEDGVCPSLRKLLFQAIDEGDASELARLCTEHADAIQDCFYTTWRKPPKEWLTDCEKLNHYGNYLLQIAMFYSEHLNRPKLLESLQPPKLEATECETVFVRTMKYIRDLMNVYDYEKAVDRLYGLLKMESIELEDNKALLWGWLGECYFHSGKAESSIQPMMKALQMCIEKDDLQSVVLYHQNLIEVYRYLGNSEEAANWSEKLSKLYYSVNQIENGKEYLQRSLRIRKGEPLNRIVVHFGSKSYELDEITPNLLEKDELRNCSVKFVFQRNRISLMPCSEMVRRGRAFGEQGYYYEALECFEAGAEWDPYSPEPTYDEALTQVLLRNYIEGVEAYKKTEELAPGWYKVRTFLDLAQALKEGNLSKDAFEAVRFLEDGPLNELDKSKLASKMVDNWPEMPIFYLLYGQSLMRLGIKSQAREVFEKGLRFCCQQADLKTSLLFSLATTMENGEEKQKLLQDAYTINGDLTAAAMAYVSLTLQI